MFRLKDKEEEMLNKWKELEERLKEKDEQMEKFLFDKLDLEATCSKLTDQLKHGATDAIILQVIVLLLSASASASQELLRVPLLIQH